MLSSSFLYFLYSLVKKILVQKIGNTINQKTEIENTLLDLDNLQKDLQSIRKIGISSPSDLSHHRKFLSVYGGSLICNFTFR